MKKIPSEARLLILVAAIPLLLSILTVVFNSAALLFLSYLFVVGTLIFCIPIILLPYLKVEENERDDEWKRGKTWMFVGLSLYVVTIIFLVVGTKMILC